MFANLRDYRKLIADLGEDLIHLRDIARLLKLENLAAVTDQQLAQLHNYFFTIAVVGEFKRGKSTFINALLGEEVLPADIRPTTATLNRVTYGLQPQAKLIFKADEHGVEQEKIIGIEDLSQFVTKLSLETELNAARIREAVIYHPTRYCRNNVDIFDTPGLADDERMDQLTREVLPVVDAVILVMMADAPFSESEEQFLQEILALDKGKVYFVLNAIDRIEEPDDRQRIIAYVRRRIERAIREYAGVRYSEGTPEFEEYLARFGEPGVFGVSSLGALQGKQAADPAQVEGSGFLELEAELERFLVQESGVIWLHNQVKKIRTAAKDIQDQIKVQTHEVEQRAELFAQQYALVEALLSTLLTMSEDISGQLPGLKARCENQLPKLRDRISGSLSLKASKEINQLAIKIGELTPEHYPEFVQRFSAPDFIAGALAATTIQEINGLLGEVASEMTGTVKNWQVFAVMYDRVFQTLRSQIASLSRLYPGLQGTAESLFHPKEESDQDSQSPSGSMLVDLWGVPSFETSDRTADIQKVVRDYIQESIPIEEWTALSQASIQGIMTSPNVTRMLAPLQNMAADGGIWKALKVDLAVGNFKTQLGGNFGSLMMADQWLECLDICKIIEKAFTQLAGKVTPYLDQARLLKASLDEQRIQGIAYHRQTLNRLAEAQEQVDRTAARLEQIAGFSLTNTPFPTRSP